MEHGLGDERHRHLAVTDVEVHRSGPAPSEGLVCIEELLDVPSLGVIQREGFDLVPIRC